MCLTPRFEPRQRAHFPEPTCRRPVERERQHRIVSRTRLGDPVRQQPPHLLLEGPTAHPGIAREDRRNIILLCGRGHLFFEDRRPPGSPPHPPCSASPRHSRHDPPPPRLKATGNIV